MSRCSPYPPPGYFPNHNKASNNTALIDSIKLQKEREIAKAERKKEKKREKKEKKREKKEKVNHNTSEITHDDDKAHKGEKSWSDFKGREYNKKSNDEVEQLERSDLTEEHGQPVPSQNPSYSSDGTQNSNKRRRHDALPPNSCYAHGNIIRIRLASQKNKDPAASASKEVLSLSGRTNLPALQKCEMAPRGSQQDLYSTALQTDICTQKVTLGPEKELRPSTSGRTEIVAKDDRRRGASGLRRVGVRYRDLIENWVPPVLQNQQPDLDEEWLFGREDQEASCSGKRFKASSDASRCGLATMWPSAQYLPEADVYALPYTVPY